MIRQPFLHFARDPLPYVQPLIDLGLRRWGGAMLQQDCGASSKRGNAVDRQLRRLHQHALEDAVVCTSRPVGSSDGSCERASTLKRFLHGHRLFAVAKQDLGDVREPTGKVRPQEQILILRSRHVFRVAKLTKPRGAPEIRRVCNRKTMHASADISVRFRGLAPSDRRSVAAKNEHGSAHEVDLGMFTEVAELSFESLGICDIIPVHARDKPASRLTQSLIEPRRETKPAVIGDHSNAVVMERRDRGECAVGASVVEDNQLKIAHRLVENGLYRGRDRRLDVTDHEKDRDQRGLRTRHTDTSFRMESW